MYSGNETGRNNIFTTIDDYDIEYNIRHDKILMNSIELIFLKTLKN